MNIRILKCKRCKWEWATRKKKDPVHCPHCKSPYWNKDKKRFIHRVERRLN